MRKEMKNRNIEEANRLAEMEYQKGREAMGIPSESVNEEGEMHMSPSGKMTNMSPSDDDYAINYGDTPTYELDGREVDVTDMGVHGRMDGSWVADNLFWKDEPMDLSDEESERFSKKYPELIEKWIENYDGPEEPVYNEGYAEDDHGMGLEPGQEPMEKPMSAMAEEELNEMKKVMKQLLG